MLTSKAVYKQHKDSLPAQSWNKEECGKNHMLSLYFLAQVRAAGMAALLPLYAYPLSCPPPLP